PARRLLERRGELVGSRGGRSVALHQMSKRFERLWPQQGTAILQIGQELPGIAIDELAQRFIKWIPSRQDLGSCGECSHGAIERLDDAEALRIHGQKTGRAALEQRRLALLTPLVERECQ